jgi:RNA polymerase sigma factor (sigma-70 family)
MTTGQLGGVIRHLHQAALPRALPGLTDGELLERFIARRDEVAFEALLRRHGPMVLGVCRRALRNEADAEDAFQATFLVLVRKAATVVPRALVGNWLYGVARNTALKAKAMNRKRSAKESEAAAMPGPEAPAEDWPELQAVLDEELSRLPEKYRVPIVLCEVEGKALKDAAQQLGWPRGTVASRLARGRGLLARALARRGMAISGGALAAPACVPAAVIKATLNAASCVGAGQALAAGAISANVAALTEGVIKAMLVAKLKMATAVLLVVTAGLGLGGLAYQARAGRPEAPKPPALAQPGPFDIDGLGPPEAPRPRPVVEVVDGFGPAGFDALEVPRPRPVPGPRPIKSREALLKARVEAAHRAYETIWRDYQMGRYDEETVYRWSLRWLSARRQASDKKAEHVAALKEHLQRMEKLEKLAPKRWGFATKEPAYLTTRDGKSILMKPPPKLDAETAVTRFYRIEAETWLAEAEKK